MFIHLPQAACAFLNLPLKTLAAGWLAGGFKPARMPHGVIPGHCLPQPAAQVLRPPGFEGD